MLSALVRILVSFVLVATIAYAEEVSCGGWGPVNDIEGEESGSYLHATEQAAINAALSGLAPDTCAHCDGKACDQINHFYGPIELETHQHPDGRWSAHAVGGAEATVQTQCTLCIMPL